MDALKAEIAAKRKNLEDPGVAARPTKYMRRGDLERLKEEEERKVQEEKRKKEEEEAKLRKEAATERLRLATLKVSMHSVRSVGMRLNRGWSRSPYQSRLPEHLLLGQKTQEAVLSSRKSLNSTFQTRKPFDDFVPKANPSDCSQSLTRTGVYVYVPSSSSKRRTTNVWAVRMISRRR